MSLIVWIKMFLLVTSTGKSKMSFPSEMRKNASWIISWTLLCPKGFISCYLCHLRETKRQIKFCWILFLNSCANCIFETPDWTMIYIDNSRHFKARKIPSLISKDTIITPIKTVQALKHEIWLLTHLLSLLPTQYHDNVFSNFSERFISTTD